MKRVKTFSIALLIVFFATTSMAQTADDIIARYVKVIGGANIISSVKSVKSTGKVTITAMAFELAFTSHMKRPNKHIVESVSPMGKVVQCTNGTDAWWINDFQGITEPTPVDDSMKISIQRGANLDGWLINRSKNGITTKYIGEEDSEGKMLQKVEITYADGHVTNAFFDKATGLLSKSTSTEDGVDSVATFHDYKEFHGRLYPTKTVRNAGGQEIVIEISTIEIDVEIADSIFEMPVKTSEQ